MSIVARRRGLPAVVARRGWWFPVVQGWVIGMVFVSSYLAAFHAPVPRRATVDVTPGAGPAAVVDSAQREHPGWWRFRPVPSAGAAESDITHGRAFAAVVAGAPPRVLYAGANGPSATAAVTRALVPAPAGGQVALQDLVPLTAGDASGLSLFYLTFGSVLAGYLFAIASVTLGPDLSATAHWTSSVVLAATLGIGVALLAGPVIGVISATNTAAVAVVLFLLLTGVAATTAMLLTLSRLLGTVIGTIVLLTLGTVSGGVLPGAMLPAWAATLRPLLPNGLALDAIRGIQYFHGAQVATGLIGLVAWALLPLAAIQGYLRLARTSPAKAPRPAT